MTLKPLKHNATNLLPKMNVEKNKLLNFQRYQLAFTQHLRQPKTSPKPAKVIKNRMAVYTEIVFNNIIDSVSACFPVLQNVLGKRAWQKLVRDFFIRHQSQTPIFREIPQQFLIYLETKPVIVNNAPLFINHLAHYEWVELALSTSDAEIEVANVDFEGDLLEKQPILSAASALLHYDYPVHKISKRFRPTQPEATYLLVFRDKADRVKFIELNAVTFKLLQLTNNENMTGRQALTKLAMEINHPDLQAIIDFGYEILQGLKAQGAIIGSIK